MLTRRAKAYSSFCRTHACRSSWSISIHFVATRPEIGKKLLKLPILEI